MLCCNTLLYLVILLLLLLLLLFFFLCSFCVYNWSHWLLFWATDEEVALPLLQLFPVSVGAVGPCELPVGVCTCAGICMGVFVLGDSPPRHTTECQKKLCDQLLLLFDTNCRNFPQTKCHKSYLNVKHTQSAKFM